MEPIEQALSEEGYCLSPNTPIGFPYGTHSWYPAGPGISCPARPYEVVVYNNEILIYRLICDYSAEPSKRFTVWPIAGFESIGPFMDYCREYGDISEPGLPAYSNSWD